MTTTTATATEADRPVTASEFLSTIRPLATAYQTQALKMGLAVEVELDVTTWSAAEVSVVGSDRILVIRIEAGEKPGTVTTVAEVHPEVGNVVPVDARHLFGEITSLAGH